jgi:hypothetical protein
LEETAMRAFLAAVLIAGAALPAVAQISGSPNTNTVAGAARACQALEQKTAQDGAGAQFRRLDQLPPGLLEHAVLRTIAGCPVREVRYQGRTYYLQPSIPRMEPLGPPPAK